MKEKISLSKNHKRIIGVTMKILEKDMDELMILLNADQNEPSYEIIKDIPESELKEKMLVVKKVKLLIKEMYSRYSLGRETLRISRILEAKKSYLWTILCDSYSDKIKRYGDFNENDSKGYDKKIDELLNLINEI